MFFEVSHQYICLVKILKNEKDHHKLITAHGVDDPQLR